MSVAAPERPDLDVTPELEQAIRDAVHRAIPCETRFGSRSGPRCDRPAEWHLTAPCGCQTVLCDPCHRKQAETRARQRRECATGHQHPWFKCACRNCGTENICKLGPDRWEPLP